MSDDPPTTVGGVKSAKDQFMKTREGTLQLAREYIDSHYDDFANATLTFRNLKTHLAESTGLPYSAFANDSPLGASLDDEVEAITKRCDTGKVDKACIFAADFVPPPEPDEPAAKASQQGGKPAKAATATKVIMQDGLKQVQVKLTGLATEYWQQLVFTLVMLVMYMVWRRRARMAPSKRQRNLRKPPKKSD